MRKLFSGVAKLIGFGVLGLIAIVVVVMAMSGGETDPAQETTATASEPAQEEKATVTREKYDEIKQGDVLTGEGGTSKEKVIELFGEPDSMTESETEGMKMEFLTWTTKDFEMVTVDFTNGNVSGKSWTK